MGLSYGKCSFREQITPIEFHLYNEVGGLATRTFIG